MKLELEATDIESLADQIAERLADRLPKADSNGRPPKLLWSESEAAGILGLSVSFLKAARQAGYILAHSTRRPVTYSWGNIERAMAWIAERGP